MKRLTPLKAIRAKCCDCCNDQLKEVRHCRAESCALWPYRMGRRPGGSTTVTGGDVGKNPTLDGDFRKEGGA